MRIKGKVEVEGFLRMCDLENGECFAFTDDSELFMVTDDDFFVNLADGTIEECYSSEYENKPIRRVFATIVIGE